MNWFTTLNRDPKRLDDFLKEYNAFYEEARKDIVIGKSIMGESTKIPAQFEMRFAQFEDLNSVVGLFEAKLKALRSAHVRKYTEHYDRNLSSRDIDRYIDGEVDVVDMSLELHRVIMLRNKFAGITKALESKQYQISNIVRLKVAGLDDSEIDFNGA